MTLSRATVAVFSCAALSLVGCVTTDPAKDPRVMGGGMSATRVLVREGPKQVQEGQLSAEAAALKEAGAACKRSGLDLRTLDMKREDLPARPGLFAGRPGSMAAYERVHLTYACEQSRP
jgi:hypothetical protein